MVPIRFGTKRGMRPGPSRRIPAVTPASTEELATLSTGRDADGDAAVHLASQLTDVSKSRRIAVPGLAEPYRPGAVRKGRCQEQTGRGLRATAKNGAILPVDCCQPARKGGSDGGRSRIGVTKMATSSLPRRHGWSALAAADGLKSLLQEPRSTVPCVRRYASSALRAGRCGRSHGKSVCRMNACAQSCRLIRSYRER
jgi:hypothetical protein